MALGEIREICAACKAVMSDGPLSEDGLVSHGLCVTCARLYFPRRVPAEASPERVLVEAEGVQQ